MRYFEPNLQLQAGGNIRVSRVVKISTAADNTVLESAAGTSANIGIASEASRRAPGTADDDGYTAISGENVAVYGPGSGQAPGRLGGTVARGDTVTSTTDGTIITTTSDADVMIGWALQSGVSGDVVAILINPCYRTQ